MNLSVRENAIVLCRWVSPTTCGFLARQGIYTLWVDMHSVHTKPPYYISISENRIITNASALTRKSIYIKILEIYRNSQLLIKYNHIISYHSSSRDRLL